MALIRFRIDFTADCSVGPGKIEILEAVDTHGSVSAAARQLGMSYRRAWLLLDSLNKAFDLRVTVNSVGGVGGGGVCLTPFGRRLVRTYRTLESQVIELGKKRLKQMQTHAAGKSDSSGVSILRRARSINRRESDAAIN